MGPGPPPQQRARSEVSEVPGALSSGSCGEGRAKLPEEEELAQGAECKAPSGQEREEGGVQVALGRASLTLVGGRLHR